MDFMSNMSYFFSEALESFKRGGIMTVTAISTICISLTVFGTFLLLTLNLNNFVSTLRSQIEITAYLEEGYTQELLEEMMKTIGEWNEIKNITYISKEDALEELKHDFGQDNFVLNAIDENPLPASFQLRLDNTSSVDEIVARLKKEIVWIDDIIYNKDLVEKINRLSSALKLIGSGLVILLGIASLLIVANTVKLTVFARRSEIEIMKLVGATNWFIRIPFIIEGAIQGIVGSIISVIVIYSFYEVIFQRINVVMPMLPLVNDTILIGKLCLKLILIGTLVGIAGSLFSVRKFLRI